MLDVNSQSLDDARWSLVKQRSRSADPSFVYAVKTTGVYCRPGCASRLPRRHNVSFFDETWQARAAGFRPCKRCRPDIDEPKLQRTEAVEIACRMIVDSESPPTLEQLAAAVDYSPSHFHKLFKQTLGVTPKAYAEMRRAKRVREKLSDGSSVTKAIYASGYGASSRFYEEAKGVLGMKPSQYRDGGEGVAIHATVVATSLGHLLVGATGNGVCVIEFGDDETRLREELSERFPNASLQTSGRFEEWVGEVVAEIDSQRPSSALPLDIRGTAFQRQVWEALREIPRGTTTTYTDLAVRIGRPTAARAVARACATNRLAVVIPCHRVIRRSGGLGGYRWGLGRKQALLDREAESSPSPLP